MKRLLFSLVAVLFAITAIGQNSVTINGVVYTKPTTNDCDVHFPDAALASASSTSITSANILGSVTIGNTEYTQVVVASHGFSNCEQLETLTLNEGVVKTNTSSFANCDKLDSVTFPASIQRICANGFYGCDKLRSVTFLGYEAPIFGCNEWTSPEENIQLLFDACPAIWNLYLPFGATVEGYQQILHFFHNIGSGNGSGGDNEGGEGNEGGDDNEEGDGPGGNFIINEGEIYEIEDGETIIIPENAGVINNGELVIQPGGQLVLGKDMTGEGGTSAMAGQGVSGLLQGTNGQHWYFIGAPFEGYKLAALSLINPNGEANVDDIAVSLWNYNEGDWGTSWPTISAPVSRGEGFFAWPFGEGKFHFSTNPADEGYENEKYAINNGDLTITKNAAGTDGKWVALANPYTFNLDIATFLSQQQGLAPYNDVQGGVVYTWTGSMFIANVMGEIKVTDGFILNYASTGEKTINFKEKQGRWYTTQQAKASAEREFVRIAMLEGEIETEVLFAQNDEATEEYDIFDANKLFSPNEIAEPYFVTNNIALVKEEVNTLPYYATMNVKSYGNKEVTFKANYIPEGLAVSIIDGEETIDLGEGVEYTTNIIAGENADRFKVLIKKSLSISDAEELDVNIFNDNRHINIETLENDLQVEVYNALGQKVLSTKDRNFTLNQVSAGAYLIKAFNNKASKTQKILVK